MLDKVEATPEIHVFRLLDFFGVEIENAFPVSRDSRVVEERVDSAVLLDDFLDDFLSLLEIGHVECVRGHVESFLDELFDFPVEFRFPDVGRGDRPSFLEKFLDAGKADSLGGSRDDCYFLFAHCKTPVQIALRLECVRSLTVRAFAQNVFKTLT